MKKQLGLILIALLCTVACLLSACTPPTVPSDDTADGLPPANNEEQNEENKGSDEGASTPPPPVLSDFERYVSNTSAPTGHNSVLRSSAPVTETFRGVFKLQEHGEKEYKFFFSNHVASTQGAGDNAYRNMPTKAYTIESAFVGTSPYSIALRDFNQKTPVSFGGNTQREVGAGESFWSDALTMNVADGHYLVFEWTVTYTLIPSIITGETFSSYRKGAQAGDRFEAASDVPMPDLIGCDRGVSLRVGFMGDSITMGFGAGPNYQYWVAQTADGLGEDISVWNLGLGYARADDAAHSPAWLEKAKQCDVVGLCFGVNDINSGTYQYPHPRTAAEITADIETVAAELAKAGVRVIIFATPPYTYSTPAKVDIWRQTVLSLEALASRKGYDFFDFATPLGKPNAPEQPAYGGHPDGEGCRIVAEALIASGVITKK